MFTFPTRESVFFFFFFNFSLNKRQTKHKSKSLREAAIHRPPHILYMLKSLGSTSPFHSWAGQAVVIQLHQQALGYWIHRWWVAMKWKALSPCPEDSSGVAVCTEGHVWRSRGSLLICLPLSSNTPNAPRSLTGAARIHTRVLEIGMYPKTVPSPGNNLLGTLDSTARAGSRGRWTALAPSCGDRNQSELTAEISGTERDTSPEGLLQGVLTKTICGPAWSRNRIQTWWHLSHPETSSKEWQNDLGWKGP